MTTLSLGLLASNRASSTQAIIDACKDERLYALPQVVISNDADSPALKRAEQEGIPRFHLSAQIHPDPDGLDDALCRALREHAVYVETLRRIAAGELEL